MRGRRSARAAKVARGAGGGVLVLGAGKVGAGLVRALRRAGVPVALRHARRGVPRLGPEVDLVVLAVRDGDLEPTARRLAARWAGAARRGRVAVVHCAGALGPEPLAALREVGVATAQMHPMISFASTRFTPSLAQGQLHLDGDPAAVRAARRLVARPLGMTARKLPRLDRAAYHAAAGLAANGAAALAACATVLLERAGVPRRTATAMLGPLLRSVAENVERLGVPDALTGPVRRGDARGVARHLHALRRVAPELIPIYVASARAQLPLARRLGEAPPRAFADVARALDEGERAKEG